MNSDTLIIKHLPPNLTDEEKEGLLKHFGVIQIKSLSSNLKKSSVVFARFQSDTAATIALRRLHQLDVMGYLLSVEFAKQNDNKVNNVETQFAEKPDSTNLKHEEETSQKYFKAFMQKLNSWNAPLNFCQPPPSHLKYLYPPPSQAVLANISRALAAVPKFYTQVLHLMNKMNLPSPFEKMYSTDVMDGVSQFLETDIDKETEVTEEISTCDESEIESEHENEKPLDVIPLKRTKLQVKRVAKKRKLVKPQPQGTILSSKHTMKPEEVFEIIGQSSAIEQSSQRKIEMKIPGETADKSVTAQSTEAGGFGLLFPPDQLANQEKEENQDDVEDLTTGSTITSEQLAANRIPSRDQKHLPVFKNYQPGIPSCRLYIKNLSKQVVERDLHFIYRKYLIPDLEEQGSMFDVRLMKEGRMKGQAFVTLQNTTQAQRALIETNGFILKDKPLVVQFARSAKPK